MDRAATLVLRCGLTSAARLYVPEFHKSSAHVIEECTVHVGGVASIALQEAVHYVQCACDEGTA